MRVFSIVLIVFLFVSCSEKQIDSANTVERNGLVYEINSETPFTGVVISKSENGQVLENLHFVDGLRDGECIEFFENGQKSILANYEEGQLNGKVERYLDNGQLVETGEYLNNAKNGLFELFSDDGDLVFKGEYAKGNLNGIIQEWYRGGAIKSRISYSNGVLDGEYKEYETSGAILTNFNYKKGLLDGRCVSYYSKDRKKMSAEYSSGKLNGAYTEWFNNGNKSKKIIYKNDRVKSESYWNEDGIKRPLLRSALNGMWDATRFDASNLYISKWYFNSPNLRIEKDRQPAPGRNGVYRGYEKVINSSFRINSFDSFSHRLDDGRFLEHKVLYLSNDKMIMSTMLNNGELLESTLVR